MKGRIQIQKMIKSGKIYPGISEDFANLLTDGNINLVSEELYGSTRFYSPKDFSYEQLGIISEYKVGRDILDIPQKPEWLFNDFLRVCYDRPLHSCYYFNNAHIYLKYVRFYTEKVLNRPAKFWDSVKDFEKTGLDTKYLFLWLKFTNSCHRYDDAADFIKENVSYKVAEEFQFNFSAYKLRNLALPKQILLCYPGKETISALERAERITRRDELEKILSSENYLRLLAGEKLSDILGGYLDEKTAWEYIFQCDNTYYYDQTIFLFRKNGKEYKGRNLSKKVAYWLLRKIDNEAMKKERIAYLPAGESKKFTYLDLLDEIDDSDIESVNDSPDKVFEKSAERLKNIYLAKNGEDVKFPPSFLKNTKEVKRIESSAELISAGKRLNNCSGGYIEACLRERSQIFLVKTFEQESMFEYAHGVIVQHRAINNSDPCWRNVDALNEFKRLNNIS